MNNVSKGEHMVTVGLALGDRYSHLCLVDTESGEVIEEGRLCTHPKTGINIRYKIYSNFLYADNQSPARGCQQNELFKGRGALPGDNDSHAYAAGHAHNHYLLFHYL
jgi:hypothetical protein